MVLRLCLKDKSSVLVIGEIENILYQTIDNQFIKVVNYKTNKKELYNKDFIWCVRMSSENNNE